MSPNWPRVTERPPWKLRADLAPGAADSDRHAPPGIEGLELVRTAPTAADPQDSPRSVMTRVSIEEGRHGAT